MRGDPEAEAQLYQVFSTGVRFLMLRKLGNASVVEDELHTSFIITIEAIRNGVVREPERLMGFIRTVISRRIAEHIDQQVFRRNRMVDAGEFVIRDKHVPTDQALMERQRGEIARKVLQEMSASDREVLVRFYLEEQTPERICREMHLTGTQYRLLKHRAKVRFAERGHRKLTIRPIWSRPTSNPAPAARPAN
ncbi:MAG TPA: sigma-70 family RNA polymerase sigma factor [Bryobacteraceae bacterium]|nr:sigma-70 family RNA polymerase sigma factor [Bryobacteraceae bacterium]